MIDQLVHVLVPQQGVLVLEIRSHRHDNVVCAIVFGLKRTLKSSKQVYLSNSHSPPIPRNIVSNIYNKQSDAQKSLVPKNLGEKIHYCRCGGGNKERQIA